MAGLPESYESLNMSLVSLSDESFNSGEIIRILAEYDKRRTRRADDKNIHREALHVTKKSDKRPNTMSKYKTKEIICYKCEKTGHIANESNTKLNKRLNCTMQ